MRAIAILAVATVLSGISAPAQAQATGPEFSSWGSCNSHLKRLRGATERGGNLYQIALWEGAYCEQAGNKYVVVFPF
jgi:hypothetical protein